MDSPITLPVLNAEELRVLGSLMEKAIATPDYYPMTINSLTLACNQKSSRKPVVQYDENTVADALNTLKRRGLISTATGGSIRSIKYKHNFAIVFPVIPSEVAVICLLMLRGPLTPGEINTNSGRLYEFESLEDVQAVLEKLSGVPEINEDDFEEAPVRTSGGLEARVVKLETDLAELREAFDKLMKELT
jgi:uncharacterized protein YceH (UPF0502 family)